MTDRTTFGTACAVLLLAASLAGGAQAQAWTAADPGVRVVTAAEMARAGVSRLSDLLALIDEWHAYSIDGYTWHASANGLAPAGDAAWTLFVDGVPLVPVAFDRIHLNALPVHVAQLDSVVVVGVPEAAYGVFSAAGAIHFYTRRPPEGFAVRAALAASNEVNDPGPFRYTALATPNVDRSGPLFLVEGTARRGSAFVRAAYKYDEFHATDVRIAERVRQLYVDPAQARLSVAAPFLQAGLARSRHRHRLVAGASRFNDFFFWAPFGAEVPATHRTAFAALSGAVDAGGADGLRYRAHFTRYDLAPRPNRDSLDLDFRQDRLDLAVETHVGGTRVHGVLGAGLRYDQTHTASALRDPSLLVGQGYGRLTIQPVPVWRTDLAVHVYHTYDRVAPNVLLHTRLRPGPGHLLSLRLAMARATIEERNSIWYWTTLGYRPPVPADATVPTLPYLPLATTVSADVGWQGRLGPHLTAGVSGIFRRFFGQTVAVHTFRYDAETSGFATATSLATGVTGRAAGARVEIAFTGVPRLSQRLYYGFTRPVWSSPAFWSAWSIQPWHQASYTASYVPVTRFSVLARLRVRGPAQWPAFGPAAVATTGRIPDRLPAAALLDLTVRKQFWGDRLAAALSLRNLFNTPYRSHPAGVIDDLSLHFDLTFALGAGARASTPE